ncbi:MAG TPA: CAP domain-containing protein, partial [Candidatus Limnocylindrales bacterium]
INKARLSHGLVPLRLDSRLRDLAEYRAGVMNSTNTMSHTVAGCLSCELNSRGIQWYSWGECIAWDGYSYPTDAINLIFQMWHDASHWPLLMSSKFNYVGLGIVHNSSNNKTWASLVLTESVDHSAPVVKITSNGRSGSTVKWTWSGADLKLQTHTSGFKSFDVEYKVNGASSWTVLRSGTTSTSLSLTNRTSGHTYYVRIRGRDNRGNLAPWTAAVGIWVP